MTSRNHALTVHDLPALSDVFPSLPNGNHDTHPVAPFPASAKPLNLDDVCLYLHSSGSTGLPKAIPQRFHRTFQNCRSSTLLSSCSLTLALIWTNLRHNIDGKAGGSASRRNAGPAISCTLYNSLHCHPVDNVYACWTVYSTISRAPCGAQSKERPPGM